MMTEVGIFKKLTAGRACFGLASALYVLVLMLALSGTAMAQDYMKAIVAETEARYGTNDKRDVIRVGQEGRFKVTASKPMKTARKVIGHLGGREVTQIQSPAQVSLMGKMMASDENGYVWYLETREDKEIRVDPETLEMTEYTLPKGAAPYSMGIDSQGTHWITAHGIEMLLEVYPEKELVISHNPPSHGFIIHISVDRRDDTVWIAQPGNNNILSYHKQRGFREYHIPTPNSGPGRLDTDSEGNVWFPELYANKLAKLDPSTGKFQEWDIPVQDALPSYARVDKNNSVWVSLPMADIIAEFKGGHFKDHSIPTPNSVVSTNVADSQGFVWFTEGGWRGSAGGNKLGRLNPRNGNVDELLMPEPNSQPLGMIIDKNDVIWFQQSAVGKICRVKAVGASRGSK